MCLSQGIATYCKCLQMDGFPRNTPFNMYVAPKPIQPISPPAVSNSLHFHPSFHRQVPVLANGDFFSRHQIDEFWKHCDAKGCRPSGIMIARGTAGVFFFSDLTAPWLVNLPVQLCQCHSWFFSKET